MLSLPDIPLVGKWARGPTFICRFVGSLELANRHLRQHSARMVLGRDIYFVSAVAPPVYAGSAMMARRRLLIWFGNDGSAASVKLNRRDFYMRNMKRNRTGDVYRESHAESCYSNGKDNDRNEEQRQGTSCEYFHGFHGGVCAAGF
jgi:hypothetical protein